MRYRAPVLTATMFAAALSLSACGGGDTKAAATSSTTVSSSSTAPSSTSTSADTAPAAPSAPAATSSTTSAPTVTKTVQPSSNPVTKTVQPRPATVTKTTSAAPVKLGGYCGSVGGMPVTAGSNTNCDFALNVARGAVANLNAGNPSAPVTAYSPATGRSITMQAGYGAHGWDLTGGNNAYVRVGS